MDQAEIHPECLKWLDEVLAAMAAHVRESRRAQQPRDGEFLLDRFSVVGVESPTDCDCTESEKQDGATGWLHKNHGAFNLVYWQRLKRARLLPSLRRAASKELRAEHPDKDMAARGNGPTALKSWLLPVFNSFLVDSPEAFWFERTEEPDGYKKNTSKESNAQN